MGLYEGIKDVAKVVQEADNIDLYRKLIDLSKQALDLQAEVLQLHEENTQLKKRKELEEVVVRHEEPVVTRRDNESRLFQVSCSENGTFICPHCNTSGVYDRKKERAYNCEIDDFQF